MLVQAKEHVEKPGCQGGSMVPRAARSAIRAAWVVPSLAVCLGGCADPNTTVEELSFGTTKGVFTSGNIRMVTERRRPLPTGEVLPILCTEPSPDVAVAFGRSGSVTASGNQPSGPSGSLAVTAASTEAVTPLSGRTAGVLALRDGLYFACQAYVNGFIGQDAYSVILSQYGHLLVALAGVSGEGATAQATAARDASRSALLVTCINQGDPSRYPAGLPNSNVSPQICRRLIGRVAAR